jgi:branched-chain amino acid aminotransferase
MSATKNNRIQDPSQILTIDRSSDQFLKASVSSPADLFFSTELGAFTADPLLMRIPLDDHMVHRGDGIFEAIKFVNSKIYLLEAHLERLEKSAQKISLTLPCTIQQLRDLLLESVKRSQKTEGLLRLFVSRGGGDFSPNPYATTGTQLFVVVTKLNALSAEKRKAGVLVGVSSVLSKSGWMAQVKSCNYLPNVMMKKEAIDAGVDFMIGKDPAGRLQEGPTENIFILNAQNEIEFPFFDHILRGCTMMRLFELVKKELGLQVKQAHLSVESVESAKAVYMVGTTLDVVRVQRFNQRTYSPCAEDLIFYEMLKKDQL